MKTSSHPSESLARRAFGHRPLPRVLLVAVLVPAVVAAQPSFPLGDDFQVETYTTTGTQQAPDIAVDAEGDFVIVWTSSGSPGDDDVGRSVQARRYAADGTPIGQQFQVNTYTSGDQGPAAVASDPAGNFVVVWESYGSVGDDTSGNSIQARRYDAMGMPMASQFQVNEQTAYQQKEPDVAMADDGRFVVVWTNDDFTALYPQVRVRSFAADGIPVGTEEYVEPIAEDQEHPKVASDPDGDVLVVWEQDSFPEGLRVFGNLLAIGAPPSPSPFQISAQTTEAQNSRNPDVAAQPDGSFLVVWHGNPVVGTAQEGIVARRIDPAGNVGPRIDVTPEGLDASFPAPAVGTDADGQAIVTWDGFAPGDVEGISGQRLEADGTLIGSEFRVNSTTFDEQRLPAAGFDAAGNFVVTFQSAATSSGKILARRFEVGGTIGDRVWRDLDADGIQDPGEPNVQGVLVHLYDYPSGEHLFSSSTDADGEYSFISRRGTRYLQFERPPDLSFSPVNVLDDDTVDSDADVYTGFTETFEIVEKIAIVDLDAGLGRGLGDRVWHDEDADGFQDEGEVGVPGIEVSLYDELGAFLESTTTDADGRYLFQSPSNDRYAVGFGVPVGVDVSPRDAADDRYDSDVDPMTFRTPLVEMGLGQLDLTTDAGLVGDASLIFSTLLADGFETGDTGAWTD